MCLLVCVIEWCCLFGVCLCVDVSLFVCLIAVCLFVCLSFVCARFVCRLFVRVLVCSCVCLFV